MLGRSQGNELKARIENGRSRIEKLASTAVYEIYHWRE
jgi:hypothetical protein